MKSRKQLLDLVKKRSKAERLKSEIAKIIEKEKLDIIHFQYIAACYGKFTFNLNLLQALKQKIPVAVTLCEVHYSYEGYSFPRKLVLKFLEYVISKKADFIIVLTKRQKEFIQKKYNPKALDFAPPGIDVKSSAKNGKNLIILGMLNWGKGIEYLLRAMKSLPGYKLLVAGKLITPEYAKLLRKEAPPSATLDFRWIPDDVKSRYLKKSNIAVYPYVWAPYQSTALNDALAYGIPVVVTKTGALWEIVEEFKCGVVVRAKNPSAIIAGVHEVAKNYQKYAKGVASYVREARWSSVAKKHVAFYKSLSK